jgi:hypothetical protein
MDTTLGPLLDAVRITLGERLGSTLGGEPCHLSIVPGQQVVADWCTCGGRECGGQATVRLSDVFPSSERFPSPDGTTKTACVVMLAAIIEVQVLRCVPRVKGKVMPTPAEQTQAALVAADDAMAMAKALACCDEVQSRPNVIGRWVPVDSGDCGGGKMTVTVQLRRRR